MGAIEKVAPPPTRKGTKYESEEKKMADYAKIADKITDTLNNFSVNTDEVAKALMSQHKTLQQSFTRLCFAWIRLCATEEYGKRTDGRNEATHKACKEILAKVSEDTLYVPMI